VGDVELADPGAAEPGEMGGNAEGLADIVGEGADVGALGAFDAEADIGRGEIEELEAVDVDELGGAFDGLAFAGEFVQGDAVDLDGGDHGRGLHLVAEAGLHLFDHVIGGDGGGIVFGDHLAIGVLGIGFDAEAEDAFVGFVVAHDAVGDLGALAEEDDEEEEITIDEINAMTKPELIALCQGTEGLDHIKTSQNLKKLRLAIIEELFEDEEEKEESDWEDTEWED